jgi:hypothetical protein
VVPGDFARWRFEVMRSFLLLVCWMFLSCGIVWGQATGQIAGTVRDASGAVIPGVDVKVTQGISNTDQSGIAGQISGVTSGDYRVIQLALKFVF